jgi:hypothetical protein
MMTNDALAMLTGTTASQDTLKQLDSFLRGELSAVETYRQAIEKITDPSTNAKLTECLSSHQQRVTLLTEAIRKLGGTPSTTSGPWGAFAKLVEGGAKVFGEHAAIAALEEGEDHGLADYKRDRDELDASVQRFVQMFLYVEQKRTHDAMSALKKLH